MIHMMRGDILKISVMTFWITLIISILSFILSLLFTKYIDNTFFYDITIGIFSGSILACGLSTVNYNVEKKKVLKNFYVVANAYIKELAKYEPFANCNEKCQFFIDYYNLPLMDLRVAFYDITFLLDIHKNKRYIKETIYWPLLKINLMVSKSYWNLKYYSKKVLGSQPKESTEKNIKELEQLLYTITETEKGKIYEPEPLKKICIELTAGRFYKLLGKENKNIDDITIDEI